MAQNKLAYPDFNTYLRPLLYVGLLELHTSRNNWCGFLAADRTRWAVTSFENGNLVELK